MSINCKTETCYKQRWFAFSILRKSGKLRDVRRSREHPKLADLFFIGAITLSLIGYVSNAAAKRCSVQYLGNWCCLERIRNGALIVHLVTAPCFTRCVRLRS